MMETLTSWFLGVTLALSSFFGGQPEPTLGLATLKPVQGGTGLSTAAPSDVGKVLKVSDDSPFTFTLQDDNTGAGGSFPWTPASWGNGTSTVLGNTLGFFANGSSTFNIFKSQHATSTNLAVSGLLTFNGVTGSTWASFCTSITGSASLCDGNDATGGAGGTTVVSTSSSETSGRVPFWTTTSGTPAELSGGVAGFAWNDTFKRLTSTYGSSTVFSATTLYGALVGNADTATALAADPANCSAGNAPLGIVASGAVEGCFDVWTEAENTSAGYVAGTRALTVAGTANQITSSAGSQNLTADRTWTLSLPSHVIFPGSYVASNGTTTNATSTNFGGSFFTAVGSSGLDFHSSNGTSVLQLGAGAGSNASFFGGVNIDGTTRLATSLTGILKATAGTVSVATAGTDYANFAYPFTPATSWFSTSTISLNTAGIMSTASSTLHLLRSGYATLTYSSTTYATADTASTTSFFGAMLRNCNSNNVLTWTNGTFGCEADDTGGGGSTDTVEWAEASTSNWAPLSLVTLSSSTIHKLNTTYASSSIVSADTFYAGVGGGVLVTAPAGTIELNGADLQFFGSGSYKFWSGASTIDAFFDATGLTASDKTFTFPDASGTLTLGTGSTGNCAQWSSTNVLTTTGVPCGSGGNTDTVLWANASTSPWSVLSLNANSSSSIAFLSSVRATSTDFISTNATTSILSASSHIRSLGTLRVDNLTSALILTGATGLAAEYTGAGCTNQVIEDLDALGAPTCRTITSAYVDSTISTFSFPYTPATTWNATSTIIRNTTGFMANASSSLAFLDVVIGTTTNATSTFAYVSSHLRAASIRNDAVTSSMVSATATGVLQATTISSPLSFSGSTLSCTTCATFAYPFTPFTSWFSTSTIMLNTAGIMSTASSTLHLFRSGYSTITYASTTYTTADTASTTNFFGAMLRNCTTNNVLTWSNGLFGCEADDTGAGSTDSVLWANASTSLWAPLSILTISSSSIAFLDSVRATSTSFISTQSTSTNDYIGTHLYVAGTTRVNINGAVLSTTAGGVIQSTTVSSPLSFSGSTLSCATCATFGWPYTPATSWNATSTILFNTAGIFSNASSTFHILKNTYASSSYASFADTSSSSNSIISNLLTVFSATFLNSTTTLSFTLPVGTNPFTLSQGRMAFDTTDNQLVIASSTGITSVVIPTTVKLWGATIASTSVDFVSGGRIFLPPQRDGFDITEIHCVVDSGTSVVINISNSGGTTDTETVTCNTTVSSDTSIDTNSSYSAGSLNSLEIGSISGSPDYVTFSVWGVITRE